MAHAGEITGIDRLSKWTAAASAYGVAGAALYTAGYFQVVGIIWMPTISTSEMIAFFVSSSQALIILLSGTIFLLFGMHVLLLNYPQLSFTNNRMVVMRALVLLFLLRNDALNFGRGTVFRFNHAMVPICTMAAISYMALKKYSSEIPGDMLFLVLFILISCNISGMYSARDKLKFDNISTIYLNEDAKFICRRIIFVGSKGILSSGRTPKSREFIKHEDYSRVYAGGKCAEPRPSSPKSASAAETPKPLRQ